MYSCANNSVVICTACDRYIAAQHSRSHLVFHYLFTLYSLLYCTLLAAMPCSLGRTRVRPTPTPSWFNDELPNSAMHPEEIEGATKANSLKVNDELLYIAGTLLPWTLWRRRERPTPTPSSQRRAAQLCQCSRCFELKGGVTHDHSRLPASFHLQPPRHLQYQDEGGSGKIYAESLYKEDNFYNEGYLFRQE